MTSSFDAWYRRDRDAIATTGRVCRGRLLLGGMIYGKWFMETFARHSLASILSPANAAALRELGATIAFYTDERGRVPLDAILGRARNAGIETCVLTMPPEAMDYERNHAIFRRLAVAQNLLVMHAARAGAAFHMLMPDHVHDKNYVETIARLGARHGNIAHGGFNVAQPPVVAALEQYRLADGSLEIPAKAIGDLAWRHSVMCAMNDATIPRRMPQEHYHLWRARDRLMLFNPYSNPAWISPATCRKLDPRHTPTGTLDTATQGLFGTAFYMPTLADNIGFFALSDPNPTKADNRVGRNQFIKRCWGDIRGCTAHLAYYTTPTETPAPIDKTAPTAAAVMREQRIIVDMMRAASPLQLAALAAASK